VIALAEGVFREEALTIGRSALWYDQSVNGECDQGREPSLVRGATALLTAFGGLLLTVAGLAADSAPVTVAGIALGGFGSPLVCALSLAAVARRSNSTAGGPANPDDDSARTNCF
jgi:hypothetical protein